MVALPFGIQINGEWAGTPLLLIGYVALEWFVGCTSWIFSVPLVPPEIANSSSEKTIDRYIANQWRLAQGFLSVGLAGVIGMKIPFGTTIVDHFGPIAILYVLSTLFLPFLLVPIFLYYRISKIESSMRRQAPD
jgi:hypothetical protein